MSFKSRGKHLHIEMESLVPSFIYPSKTKDKINLWINSIDFKKAQVQAVDFQNQERSRTVYTQPRLKISPKLKVQLSLKILCYFPKATVQFHSFILKVGCILISYCSE